MRNTQLRLIHGGREDRGSELNFFHAAVALAALAFVALLFVVVVAIAISSLERI